MRVRSQHQPPPLPHLRDRPSPAQVRLRQGHHPKGARGGAHLALANGKNLRIFLGKKTGKHGIFLVKNLEYMGIS